MKDNLITDLSAKGKTRLTKEFVYMYFYEYFDKKYNYTFVKGIELDNEWALIKYNNQYVIIDIASGWYIYSGISKSLVIDKYIRNHDYVEDKLKTVRKSDEYLKRVNSTNLFRKLNGKGGYKVG